MQLVTMTMIILPTVQHAVMLSFLTIDSKIPKLNPSPNHNPHYPTNPLYWS